MEEGEKKYKEGIAYGLWAGWLFGFAGLHRLYLGKYGTGFLWLFTWGCFGIGQLYDLITMRRQDLTSLTRTGLVGVGGLGPK